MRVLCLEDVLNGSKYHRLKLPYSNSKIKASFTTELNDLVLANCDILVINYNCAVSFQVLDYYRKSYKFKLILDIDDSWVYPKNHPLFFTLQGQLFNFKMLMMMADAITCSTFELHNMIKEYTNAPVRVIENYVPHTNVDPNTQFQITSPLEDLKTFLKRDLRIGLLGSESHYPDYLEIKRELRQIVKIPNTRFKLCGFSKKSKVLDLFEGLHSYYDLYPPKTTEKYMSLYDEVDVLLCPLVNNNLNICKSSLKRFEALSKGKILILDRLYSHKSDNQTRLKSEYYVNVSGTGKKQIEDWVGTVKNLLKNKEELWEQMHKLPVYYELSSSLFPDKINTLKKFLEDVHSGTLKTNLDNPDLKLYTIKYGKNQEDMFEPYINTIKTVEEKSYLFEHNVMLDVVKNTNQYYGVFSHKFRSKTGFNKEIVTNILNYNYNPANVENPKNVVVSFCRSLKHSYLAASDHFHPNFYKRFKEVCDHIGLKCPPIKTDVPFIYSSFFVAHSYHYLKFLEYLKKAVEYMESPENKNKYFENAEYRGLSPELLKEHTGLEYYPLITFIVERLMSMYCITFNLTVKNYELFSNKNLNFEGDDIQ